MISGFRIGNQRAQPQAAVRGSFDLSQWKMRDVHQVRRARDVFLHQVQQVCSTGDAFAVRCGEFGNSVGYISSDGVREAIHKSAVSWRSRAKRPAQAKGLPHQAMSQEEFKM